jgi:hypothetical protein
LLAVLLTIIAAGAYTAGASAQTTGETTTLTTYVRLCLEPGCTEDLELTEPVDGVPVEIADAASGEVLGTCTTGDLEAGACAADIATVESVTISLDESAFPEGYQATDNPGQLNLADATEYPFLLQQVDGFPEDDAPEGDSTPVDDAADDSADAGVSELPSTGMQAGTPVSDDDVSALPSTGMQVGTPESDSVAALPETGSGSDDGSTGIVVTASVLAIAALGLVALGTHRYLGRNQA